jgi:uncharacterized membrane protein
MKHLPLYLVSLAAFFVIDIVWLGVAACSFYRQQLGLLMAPNVNWPVAVLFYLLFVAGLLLFVIVPGLIANSLKATLVKSSMQTHRCPPGC